MEKRGGLRQKDDFHRSFASALLFAHVTISLGQPIKGGGGNTTIQKKKWKKKKNVVEGPCMWRKRKK